MQLLPIPTTDEHIRALAPHWVPFLPMIAKRSKESTRTLVDRILTKEVQPILIWDEDNDRAVAMLGIRYHHRNDDLIAEWIWMTGTGMKRWVHLLGELERYLTEHMRCAEIRPICRPGWSRILRKHGYRITHYTMTKEVRHGL